MRRGQSTGLGRRDAGGGQSGCLQTERLATDRVQVRQSEQLVIRDLLAVLFLRLTNFGPELGLDIRVHAEEV